MLFLGHIHHATAMKPILHQEEWNKMIFDACRQGYLPEEIFYYIEEGGSFNLKIKNNYTPLHIACKCNHLDIVKFLLRHNADINGTMNGLLTPLHCSVLAHNVILTQYLLDAGANIDAQTIHGDTALDLAYYIKHDRTNKTAIIELFALHMFKRFIANKSGAIDDTIIKSFTPLHCSVFIENVKMTQYLLNEKTDIDVKTIHGDTALDIAKFTKNQTIIELFPNQSDEEKSDF